MFPVHYLFWNYGWVTRLCELPKAAVTKYYCEQNDLKKKKKEELIGSWFWRLEVQNQVVRRFVLHLKPRVENPSLPLLASTFVSNIQIPQFRWSPCSDLYPLSFVCLFLHFLQGH